MFSIKLVLVAILIFLGCALAQSLQGEALGSELAGSSNFDEVVRQEGARWRGGNNNNNNNNNNNDDDEEENNDNEVAFPPCVPPKGGRPVTAAPTQEATEKPTTRPTTAPTTRPITRPSTAPTTRPTEKATQKPTEKATQKPTEKATQKPTEKATQKPTEKATQKPTSAPTQKATQKPTEKATQKPTSAPTQKATQKPSTGGSNVGLCDVVPVSSEPLKMLLPLYNYPDSSWDQVISAASKVDIVAIINPNSGPGGAPSSTYTTYMNKLNTAGVEQVGYVYTSYAGRSISAVKADIDTYASKFPHVTGIFFDEASNKASDIPFYRELYNYVLAKGYKHSILNPGTSTDAGYVDISTTIVIYESSGSGISSKSFPSYLKCASTSSHKAGYKYKFSGMAHSTSSSSMASYIEKFATAGMGMVFVTDGAEGCCTYNKMAGYFTSEITAIQSYNKK